MRRQYGFSLVETLIAMALVATAMTIVAVTLTAVHHAHRTVREQTGSEMELHRLTIQLRADAHLALSSKLEDGQNKVLEFSLNDEETVLYTLRAGRIQRDQRRGDDIVHHETYRLPDGYTGQWQLDENGSATMASLKLDPEPGVQSGRVGVRPEEIKAAVGLLNQSPTEQKS